MADLTGHGQPPEPVLSVTVATRNRREEVRQALRSIVAQDVGPLELIVLDDGSTDGTAEMVEREFPDARLLRSERRIGVIAQRNLGAREARAPVIAQLDDDCVLVSPRTLGLALRAFDHPRVGAVMLPLVEIPSGHEPRGDEVPMNLAPDSEQHYVTDTYAGGACLLRRDALLRLGGYRPEMRRGQDADHARRMLQAGLVVRVVQAPPVEHRVSPQRVRGEYVYWQAYAQMLGTTWSLPLSAFPRRIAHSLGHGLRQRVPGAAVLGVARGLGASWRRRHERRPLDAALARALRRMERERLARRHTTRLEDLEPDLAPLPDR